MLRFLPVCAVLVLAALLPSCSHSTTYRPADTIEQQLWYDADPKVLPDDVRRNARSYDQQMMVWSGVLVSVRPADLTGGLRLVVKHHYWDWIQDHGPQQPKVAFLSPRGEGMFECVFPMSATVPSAQFQELTMVVAYGTVKKVDAAGRVVLDCRHVRQLPRDGYTTSVHDYGRNFLLHADSSDFRVLAAPTAKRPTP
jgi:hypothetical protein